MQSQGRSHEESGAPFLKQSRIFLVLYLCLCLTLTACVGVTPLPQRIRTPQGEVNNLNLNLLKPGQTTLSELRSALSQVDTGFESDHYFLGRWNSSTWGAWAFLCGDTGGCIGPTGGRHWGIINLLAEFDETGKLKTYGMFSDESLLQSIAPLAAELKEKNAGSGTEFVVQYLSLCKKQGSCWPDASLTLSTDSFEFQDLEPQPKKDRSFKVPARNFLRLTKGIPRISADPVYTTVVLHFAEDLKDSGGPRGRSLILRVTLPEAIILSAFAQEQAYTP